MRISATVAENRARRGLVLAKYDLRAASTRQRIAQVMPYLAPLGVELTIAPLFDNAYLAEVLVRGRRSLCSTVAAYWRRLRLLKRAAEYDFIWVQYELFPYLPGLCERALNRYKNPVILDYDDAIFHQYDQHKNPLIRRVLGTKLAPLLARADLVMCGNRYLSDYCLRRSKRVEIIPTVVDVTHYLPRAQPQEKAKLTVGWIGSPSTWAYVAPLLPLLTSLVHAGKIEMLVIGAGPAADRTLPFTFRDWEEAREIADIQAMDIGIMPIPDAPWARGKCGYKLIQYMACGLPVVASPVGVNSEIVVRGVNGFLASTEDEWHAALELLLREVHTRVRMGEAGRKTVEARYSIQYYGPKVAALISAMLPEREPWGGSALNLPKSDSERSINQR